jgi:uncharacterized membrane protein
LANGQLGRERSWEPTLSAAYSRGWRAKSVPDVKFIEILQGKWLGHPLHSALVHIPVGSWIAACLLDVANRAEWTPSALEPLATYCVAFGLLGALLAVGPGIADWLPIKKEKPAWKIGVIHMALNVAAVAVWTVNLTLRLRSEHGVTSGVLGTSVVGTLLVFVSGYLGSLMVFDQGTAVARESKKEWRAIARRAGSRVPEKE